MAGVAIVAAAMAVAAVFSAVAGAGIGANWGTMSSHPLRPNIVVKLLKDNGIKKVKLFDSDSWTVSSLSGSKIETIIGIPNDQLKKFAESYDEAKDWVKENVTTHMFEGGVDIRFPLFISLKFIIFVYNIKENFEKINGPNKTN